MANDNKKQKVFLFVCHDVTGLVMLNGIVPAIKKMGLEPVIINTRNNRNRKFRNPTPAIVSACNVAALENIILPFMEEKNRPEALCLTYKQLAEKYSFSYRETTDVNAPEFIQDITADPDIIGAISIRFLQVFEPSIIEAFNKKGFMWNLHSGLLGKYKGLLLPYRAIENGEQEYGLTLHQVVPGIDEGGIIAKSALPLNASKPVMDLYLDTTEKAINMVTENINKLRKEKSLNIIPQYAKKMTTYYSNPTAQEFIRFVERGIFYIDPDFTIQRIADTFMFPGTPDNLRLTTALKEFLGVYSKDTVPPPKKTIHHS